MTDLVPKSTLARLLKSRKPLSTSHSQKILGLIKVYSEALRIYHGDTELVARFLASPHTILGNRRPIDLATESNAGTDLVLKILARADAGVAV